MNQAADADDRFGHRGPNATEPVTAVGKKICSL
jgi:hypothetical protein